MWRKLNLRMINGRRIQIPRFIAERALGKLLPSSAEVHHRDGNYHNNLPSNLIICENRAYHKLLEVRERAYRATGDPHKRLCVICSKYDDVSSMLARITRPRGSISYRHNSCHLADQKQRRKRALEKP